MNEVKRKALKHKAHLFIINLAAVLHHKMPQKRLFSDNLQSVSHKV